MKSIPASLPPGVLPDLLHQTAFNLCAALAHSWGGPVALRSGNPLYAAELALRLETLSQAGRGARRPMLVWADPCLEDLPEVGDLLDAFPPDSAVLILFPRPQGGARGRGASEAGRYTSRAAPPSRAETRQHTAGPGEILSWLAARCFQEEVRYGIGGREYRFWSRLAYLAEHLGHADRADRFRARARAALLVGRKEASAAILTLILTVRRSG